MYLRTYLPLRLQRFQPKCSRKIKSSSGNAIYIPAGVLPYFPFKVSRTTNEGCIECIESVCQIFHKKRLHCGHDSQRETRIIGGIRSR